MFAVRVARSYPITTVQFLVTGGSVARLWGSEVARCIRRGFFEVTAGECDELDTTSYQHGMNGDCIAEDDSTNREDKTVTEAQPSQLKSQKYHPIPCHLLLRIAQMFDVYERAETNQAGIYGAASSRCQKCLFGTGVWYIWIPSTHSSIKPQEIPRKSHMSWMPLKLQVSQAAACLCLLMSFSNLSRASSSCQGLVGFCTPSIDYSALSIYLSNSPRPG
ncbi:unnamed protein product [Penicillium nalgiovense]|nr:unnamed protein product [Penicillium nalgiovense]CAG8198935.1 unnamed protein product [Penicillium nalgiovense]